MAAESDSARTRLEADVYALAALDRRTTSDGERRSAEMITSRLSAIGAADITTSSFRGPSSWAPAQLAYVCAGLIMGSVPGRLARAASLAVAAAYELETSSRVDWVRRVLPTRRGVSVSARIPASGATKRTLVLVAHHDAAHTGLVWHPRAVALSRGRARMTGGALPTHAPALAALATMAIPVRPARRVGSIVLALSAILMVQACRSPTAPGANDNASGVAGVLELTRRLLRHPLPDTEVLLVFPGGEEVGNAGMSAWMRTVGRDLDPATTLVVNLDAIGSTGHLAVSDREGMSTTFGETQIRRAKEAAQREGLCLQVAGLPNSTDAVLTRHAGLPTISLVSIEDGWISNLHRHTDTAERVDWQTVEDAVRLVERIADTWAERKAADA